MSDPATLLWLVPAFPLAACIITAFLGPVLLRKQSHWPTILGAACSFGCSLLLLISLHGITDFHPQFHTNALTWFAIDNFEVHFGLQADALTAVMLVAVTFCGTMIAIFSSWYMHNEDGYPRFFAIMSLFLFSMTGLVLANNFIVLYAFWEGVGLCSYLLIGFWFTKPSAAAAARKAFLVTRLGDAGMILGIMLLWLHSADGTNFKRSLDLNEILLRAHSSPYVTTACLLLLCGAVGKSAQFPLHVWLPDAMEGPTPVSALIHAATMVTAGVYLVARCSPLFVLSPVAQLVVAIIGGFTALLAAAIALTQYDLKRVLAYSTMSQLGFMFLALGAGLRDGNLIVLAASAAIFHLFTHAFFKALLFLSAGSVMVSMGHVIDMRRFSGLRKVLPTTHWTFLCGAVALAGLPIFSGFWSKDLIMDAVMEAGESTSPYRAIYLILLVSALITAAMTAFYTFRAYYLTFHGEEKIPPEAFHHAGEGHSEVAHPAHAHGEMEHPKNFEQSMAQKLPLIVLAICALFIGLASVSLWHIVAFLGRSTAFHVDKPERHTNWLMMGLSTVGALAGLVLATWMYYWRPGTANEVAARVPKLYEWSLYRFRFDELYGYLIIGPLNVWAQICRFFDAIVDGIVDLVGLSPRLLARFLQLIQNGLVQFYALVTIVFVTAFMAILVIWFGR